MNVTREWGSRRGMQWFMALWLGVWLVACVSGSPPLSVSVNAPSAVADAVVDDCSLEGITPEVLSIPEADADEWHGTFDLADVPQLWEAAPRDRIISQFRDGVRARLGTDIDPRALIERQRAISASLPVENRGDVENATLLLDGRAGRITSISCIEAMLWKWQAARYPMLEHPTEFGAFILRGQGRVRIYLSSADLVGQRIRRPVTELVKADVTAGTPAFAHVHNHPFLFDRRVGDRMWTTEATTTDVAGALAPSMTDVEFYRNVRDSLGLEQAWVTNGFDTARFDADDFDVLRSR